MLKEVNEKKSDTKKVQLKKSFKVFTYEKTTDIIRIVHVNRQVGKARLNCINSNLKLFLVYNIISQKSLLHSNKKVKRTLIKLVDALEIRLYIKT